MPVIVEIERPTLAYYIKWVQLGEPFLLVTDNEHLARTSYETLLNTFSAKDVELESEMVSKVVGVRI